MKRMEEGCWRSIATASACPTWWGKRESERKGKLQFGCKKYLIEECKDIRGKKRRRKEEEKKKGKERREEQKKRRKRNSNTHSAHKHKSSHEIMLQNSYHFRSHARAEKMTCNLAQALLWAIVAEQFWK